MRHTANVVALIFIALQAMPARGQSTAELISRLQQQASAARARGLDETGTRLLRELEMELANDRYPSPEALLAFAPELSRTGGGVSALAPGVQELAARWKSLTEIADLEDSVSAASDAARSLTADLERERQVLRQAIDRWQLRLDRMGIRRASWENYLLWNEARNLPQNRQIDGEALDRLEVRWTNVHLAWNDPDLGRTAQAVRRFIRQVRRATDPTAADVVASSLMELAALLRDGLPRNDDQQAQLATALATLESRAALADLTTAVRARASHPNAVFHFTNRLLEQRLAQQLDEAFRIDDFFAGTRAMGNGHLVGVLDWRPTPNPAAAGWTWNMRATTNAATTGFNSGVRVDSRSATTMSGSKRFRLDATGLSALPTATEARSQVQFTGIAAGGGRRQGVATSEVYANRPQAEAESAASARRSVVRRLDGEAAVLLTEFDRQYDRLFKSPLANSKRFVSTVRARGDETGQLWSCWLEELHGIAALVPARAPPAGLDATTSWHCTFVERYAAVQLAGREYTPENLSRELDQWLGGQPSAPPADAEASTARLKFAADRPIDCRIADGLVRLRLRLAEFADANTVYPAVAVNLVYEPRKTANGWALAKSGAAEAYPLDYEPGTGRTLSGRQLALRQAVRRSLEATLRPELEVRPMALKWSSAATLRLVPQDVRAGDGWLSIGWQSPASAAAIASGN